MAQARKLKVLEEEESGRFKRLLADAMLDNAAPRGLGLKTGEARVQRKVVEHARQLFGISERWPCSIFCVDGASVRYAPRRSYDGDLQRGCVRSRLRVRYR